MRTRAMRAAGIVGAALLLATLVGSATAGKLSVSNRAMRTTWTGLEFSGGFVTIRCAATLEGSFHSATIRKTPAALIGSVSRATIHRPCAGGLAWFFDNEANEVLGGSFRGSMPWHIVYEGFSGLLPTITRFAVSLAGMRFAIRALIFGTTILCEYLTGPANGGSLNGAFTVNAAGALTSFAFDETRRITSLSGGVCPEVGLGGAGNVRLLGSTITITLSLI